MGKSKGLFVSVDFVNLFQDGKITLQEMYLLTIIDNLVTAKGEGCFASNAYLGKKMCLGRDRIQKIISNLKKLGLVHQVRFDGRKRFLETIKSKIDTRADEYKMDVPSEDDISQPYEAFLDSPEWEAKREEVKARAFDVCERCGDSQATRYHCHHLTYEHGWDCDVKYLQWLCRPCHQFIHDKSDNDPMLVSETDLSEVW